MFCYAGLLASHNPFSEEKSGNFNSYHKSKSRRPGFDLYILMHAECAYGEGQERGDFFTPQGYEANGRGLTRTRGPTGKCRQALRGKEFTLPHTGQLFEIVESFGGRDGRGETGRFPRALPARSEGRG